MDSDCRGNWVACRIDVIPIVQDSIVVTVIVFFTKSYDDICNCSNRSGCKTVTCSLLSVKNVKSSETNA